MDLYDLRNEFDKSGIMMCFNGPFSNSIIEETGKAMRNHLASENIAKAAVLDVFAVYIELAQNIHNYLVVREITPPEAMSSIISIAKKGEKYVVSSGNMVLHEDGKALLVRVEEVNNMSPEEKKRHYRELLRRDIAPGSLGAGLGFLDIAKRTSEKLECTFRVVDDTFGFFTLTVFI